MSRRFLNVCAGHCLVCNVFAGLPTAPLPSQEEPLWILAPSEGLPGHIRRRSSSFLLTSASDHGRRRQNRESQAPRDCSASKQRAQPPGLLGPKPFLPQSALYPFSHIRLRLERNLSLSLAQFWFIPCVSSPRMVPQSSICHAAKGGGEWAPACTNTGSGVFGSWWSSRLGFPFILMVHIPLPTSVSDFQGTTLILHQTFPVSPHPTAVWLDYRC